MEIRNRTPLPAALNVVLDKRAAEHLVLCVKGTWRISSSGRLALAEEQKELLVVDDCVGEPGVSSVRHEADLGPVKPATDCALAGSAIAPRKGTREMEVGFAIAGLRQRAQVLGERRWTGGMLGAWIASGPEPFERTPLDAENLFRNTLRDGGVFSHRRYSGGGDVGAIDTGLADRLSGGVMEGEEEHDPQRDHRQAAGQRNGDDPFAVRAGGG